MTSVAKSITIQGQDKWKIPPMDVFVTILIPCGPDTEPGIQVINEDRSF